MPKGWCQHADLKASVQEITDFHVPKIYTEREQKQEAAKPMEYDFTGKTILLVEDHVLNIEVAKQLLMNKGAKVEVAEMAWWPLKCSPLRRWIMTRFSWISACRS